MLPKAHDLLASHREQGHQLLIITATNRFITQPIAHRLGIDQLIACEGEMIDGKYTGEPLGTPSYGRGKVSRLKAWTTQHDQDLDGAFFYSDSHNDLPLLESVDNPIAVDPDPTLHSHALNAGWPIISLR